LVRGEFVTRVYFVRHAETDISVKEDAIRPLSAKGMRESLLVTEFLQDKSIDVILSSPYKRTLDTLVDFSSKSGIGIDTNEDFRERAVGVWVEDFNEFASRQWSDFSYKLDAPESESLQETQDRNIRALNDALKIHQGKNIAIGTHGTALSTIINYYDNGYRYDDFMNMVHIMPWVVMMEFDGLSCENIVKIDLFSN